MNIMNNKKLILQYPLTIILFSIIVLTIITMLFWYGIYSPIIEKSKQQGYELKKKVSEIDRKLKNQHQLVKKLKLAQFNMAYSSAISQQNKTTMNLLNDISKLGNISKTRFSLSEKIKDTIIISLQPKNIAKFYGLVETIESRRYVDRLTILKNNKEYTLTIYVRHLRGDEL